MIKVREGALLGMTGMLAWYALLLAPDRRIALDQRIYEVAQQGGEAAATGLETIRHVIARRS